MARARTVEGTDAGTLDLNGRYSVAGYGGVAFYLRGYASQWTEETWTYVGGPDDDHDDPCNYVDSEPEEVTDYSRVRAVMVGDDYEHVVDVDDRTPIGENDYCPGCGQIGCGHYR